MPALWKRIFELHWIVRTTLLRAVSASSQNGPDRQFALKRVADFDPTSG
jgi:hypothetical protein